MTAGATSRETRDCSAHRLLVHRKQRAVPPPPGEGHLRLPRSFDYSASESTCGGQHFCLTPRPTQSALSSPLASPGRGDLPSAGF